MAINRHPDINPVLDSVPEEPTFLHRKHKLSILMPFHSFSDPVLALFLFPVPLSISISLPVQEFIVEEQTRGTAVVCMMQARVQS
ncbi:hypothetical protein EVAR_77808_1 [Eumeta japonica]|uniref:Uncharacterized protein n=1 Tax=Eumeta variegata TaxID=151549 RepID=A0A4C1TDP7_EUMVA|nr:hypothetical protein EVAR_77808_1 [Eumeta japonica]